MNGHKRRFAVLRLSLPSGAVLRNYIVEQSPSALRCRPLDGEEPQTEWHGGGFRLPRPIELLAPARDAQCAIEAIKHGADAVYLGAPQFGARAAVPVALDDVRRVADEARLYGAKIHIALNTVLSDRELSQAAALAWQLYEAGADALIVQDMGLLAQNLPPIALHASTQCDLRTPERARLLCRAGFSRIVPARELSLDQLRELRRACPEAELEVFVHGALCVSYSGQCYASEYCFHRSANRGRCAQFCRLPFFLEDAGGRTVAPRAHYLSLKDMNRSAFLEELIEAGVSAFKIEGRLKDIGYVKNITAFYRRCLDEIIDRRSDLVRASYGRSHPTFTPDPQKSFNRGFTEYFLHGRSADTVAHWASPKSLGEPLGTVARLGRRRNLTVRSQAVFSPGDGICFHTAGGQLDGSSVNRVLPTPDGAELLLTSQPQSPAPGTTLFRNEDHVFARQLARPSARRTLALFVCLSETPAGYLLRACDEAGREAEIPCNAPHEDARTPQQEQIEQQLERLGDTPFRLAELRLSFSAPRFIPASQLSAWRRDMVAALLAQPLPPPVSVILRPGERANQAAETSAPQTETSEGVPHNVPYSFNVANRAARAFYIRRGAVSVAPAYEQRREPGAALMTCRYCLLQDLGYCPRHGGHPLPREWKLPLRLRPDTPTISAAFPLRFDCALCQMEVRAPHT